MFNTKDVACRLVGLKSSLSSNTDVVCQMFCSPTEEDTSETSGRLNHVDQAWLSLHQKLLANLALHEQCDNDLCFV